MTKDAVGAFCRRNGLTGNMAGKAPEGTGSRCKECGAALVQADGMKTRVFCSAQCRKKWWKEHPISRIEPKIPALKERAKVAAYARVSMENTL